MCVFPVVAQSIQNPELRKQAVVKGLLAPELFDSWPEIAMWTLVACVPLCYLATQGRVLETLSTDRALMTMVGLGVVHVGQSCIDIFFVAQNKFVTRRIPAQSAIIDRELDRVSRAYVRFNRWQTVPFALAVTYYAAHSENVIHNFDETTFMNTIGVVILWLIMYDGVYYWFHRFLHVKAVYPYIHKHHHQNVAPFRGNIDGINTHPLEYVIGMYLHLFCMFCGPRHSIYGLYLFSVAAGIGASVNHTRFDVSIPLLFHTQDHDNHHRYFTICYGQYIMLWDVIFGTFKKRKATLR